MQLIFLSVSWTLNGLYTIYEFFVVVVVVVVVFVFCMELLFYIHAMVTAFAD